MAVLSAVRLHQGADQTIVKLERYPLQRRTVGRGVGEVASQEWCKRLGA
jgi:hypothetical protein